MYIYHAKKPEHAKIIAHKVLNHPGHMSHKDFVDFGFDDHGKQFEND